MMGAERQTNFVIFKGYIPQRIVKEYPDVKFLSSDTSGDHIKIKS